MGHFDRRSVALERTTKRRSPSSRFAGLGDRLARTFAVTERPQQDWEPDPDETADYQVHDERDEAWDHVLPRFPITRHGYECAAVDSHVAELEQELSELDRELTELRASKGSENAVEAEIHRIGEQTSTILLAAHDKAQETTRKAQEQADRVLSDAAANAISITRDANRKLHEMEAEKLSVWRERARLLEDVGNLSRTLARLAGEAGERFPSEPTVTPVTAAAADRSAPETNQE